MPLAGSWVFGQAYTVLGLEELLCPAVLGKALANFEATEWTKNILKVDI